MKKSKNILLVEDNENDQLLFGVAIKEIDGSIIYDVANNGKEALAKLDSMVILPDLIFMDIHMPEMGGIECLTEIRKRPQTKNIPVVMLSSDTSEMDHTRNLGAKAFLKKPDDLDMLQVKIEEMINLDFIADNGYIGNQTFKTALAIF
jgi:CheY-like chemotaxis protein